MNKPNLPVDINGDNILILISNRISKLSTFLIKLSEEESLLVSDLDPFPNMHEEWDLNKEDKKIRESQSLKGWHLSGEENKRINKLLNLKLPWINHDIEKHVDMTPSYIHVRPVRSDEITNDMINAINKLGDGFRPEYIGHGAYGVVWDIGSDRLLKIYKLKADKLRVDISRNMTFDEGPYASGELMVLDYGRMGISSRQEEEVSSRSKDDLTKSTDDQLGWRIMEKLILPVRYNKDNSVTDSSLRLSNMIIQTKIIVKSFIEYLPISDELRKTRTILRMQESEDMGKAYSDYFKYPYVQSYVKELLRLSLREAKSITYTALSDMKLSLIEQDYDLSDGWFEKFVRQMIILLLTNRSDTHMGNVGIRPSTGEIILFDA